MEFNAEMNISGINPPKDMDIYTCNCFVKKVVNGSSIESAQSSCKDKASKKFNL